ncbi:MAG: sigma-70 family RNA polymerase sigma factor [Clostridia bacterium]|nr:sigma-70 family RNA polymerase sigma factor [Clostridia bacterium]
MNDIAIIELFWQRSERAIERLAEKYGRLAESVAMNILHDRLDTEECMNDSYLGMWNSLPPERPRMLPAYFTAITRNLALKRCRYRHTAGRSAILCELTDLCGSTPSPEEELNEAARIIGEFLEKLDKPSRVLFMRRYYLCESVADAAEAIGISENTAGVRLSRMRAKLKKMLESEGILV